MSDTRTKNGRMAIKAWIGKRIALIGAFVLLICLGYLSSQMAPDTSKRNWPMQFTSAGQRLYFTGQGTSGQRMLPSGGNHHMTMMGSGACVDCHGTNREGGRLWPSFWSKAPAITFSALSGAHGEDGHDHETYSAETLAKAIADGVRPDGTSIGPGMPRWSMPSQSLDDLVNYLLSPPNDK